MIRLPAVLRNKVAAAGLALVLLLSASPLALDLFRPAGGYRKSLAGLIYPGVLEPAPMSVLEARNVDFVVDFYGFRYRGNTSNLIDRHVCYYGTWEKSVLYFIRDTLAGLGPGAIFIDVGANVGLHSLFASKYANTVHAFEPYPPILTRLHAFVDENRVDNVVVHSIGLGETEAELPFYTPPGGNLGTGSFVPSFGDNSDEGLNLRIVPGDKYFPEAGITEVSVIKMDIEGYEKAALAGLRETLRQHRPIVEMEISIDRALLQTFQSRRELESAFPEGYEFYHFAHRDSRSGAYRLERFDSSFDDTALFNLVCIPEEKSGIVPMVFAGESTVIAPR